jgi:hypothetical protein
VKASPTPILRGHLILSSLAAIEDGRHVIFIGALFICFFGGAVPGARGSGLGVRRGARCLRRLESLSRFFGEASIVLLAVRLKSPLD